MTDQPPIPATPTPTSDDANPDNANPDTAIPLAGEAAPSTPAPTEKKPASPGAMPPAAHEPYEKSAADLRKEEDSASPFSVTVGKIYDGPLDLLLDLVRRQNIDIYDIPIAKITAQFLAYVEHLKAADVDTAGEFIYMSALLIHIKSKMLLPRSPAETAEGEAEDPRHELVERLLEHERFRNAAQMLQQKRQLEEATWTNPGMRDFRDTAAADQDIAADTLDLVRVFRQVLERAKNRPVLEVGEDAVTVRQMIDYVRRRMMMEDRPVALSKLLSHTRTANAIIAMFLALLELVRLQAVLLRQDRTFSEIYVKKHEQFEQVINDRLSVKDDWS